MSAQKPLTPAREQHRQLNEQRAKAQQSPPSIPAGQSFLSKDQLNTLAPIKRKPQPAAAAAKPRSPHAASAPASSDAAAGAPKPKPKRLTAMERARERVPTWWKHVGKGSADLTVIRDCHDNGRW